MVLWVWRSRSGRASPCFAWKLSRTAWRTASGWLVSPPLGGVHQADGTTPRVFQDAADVPQGLVRHVVSAVSFAFLGRGRYAVGVPFLELVAAGGEERAEVAVLVSCFRCAGAQQGGEFLFRCRDVMDELLEGEVRWWSRVAGVALHAHACATWRMAVVSDAHPGGAESRVGPCYTCARHGGCSRLGTVVWVGGCRLAGWPRVGVGEAPLVHGVLDGYVGGCGWAGAVVVGGGGVVVAPDDGGCQEGEAAVRQAQGVQEVLGLLPEWDVLE